LPLQIPGNGLNKPQASGNRVARVANFTQVVENGRHAKLDLFQIGRAQQVVDGEIFHQQVEVVDLFNGLIEP